MNQFTIAREQRQFSVRFTGVLDHHMSLDWIIWGDLKGLQQMTNRRRAQRFMTHTSMETEA
jgi:hypothetical protein